jgi:hypothetical protein
MRQPHKNANIERILVFVEGAIACRDCLKDMAEKYKTEDKNGGPKPGKAYEEYHRAGDSHLVTGLRLLMGDELYDKFKKHYIARFTGFHQDAVGPLSVEGILPSLEWVLPHPAPEWVEHELERKEQE